MSDGPALKGIYLVETGDKFASKLVRLTEKNKRQLKSIEWEFNWHKELEDINRETYKLVTLAEPNAIQGLVSLSVMSDHVFVHLVENAAFNRGGQGRTKKFEGVAGMLFAFACKRSVEEGYEGFVAFQSKTDLIGHYRQKFKAEVLFHSRMIFDSRSAQWLINQFF
ncbi:hypothetical protein [Spirosoma pollinicola]|uniref:GNAT family N-acetyltransferase n=1 Tax=Spirosoma pollinicola TaxID=2057025 RepID=A0A2K8ZB33_9BACT|nr:hypothetical protein [Spirosoma pollinicola]AUD07083.1 hypothetical protein CWM47_37860 [Spirosoma pollinicola]